MIVNSGKGILRSRVEAVTGLFAGNFYMALSGDTAALNVTDTALTAEQTTNGLARAVVTAAHTTGTNAWVFSNTFTFSGSTTTPISKVALFDAATGGNLIVEYLAGTPTTFNTAGDNAQYQISIGF